LPQIDLFHDSIDGYGSAKTSTKTRKHWDSKQPVIFMGTVAATQGSDISATTSDLLIIRQDGEIRCLDGDSLEDKWMSPSNALERDASQRIIVEFAHLTNAVVARRGILKARPDIFTIFPQEITQNGFNPDVLIIITKSSGISPSRKVQIVTLPWRPTNHSHNLSRPVESLLRTVLPSTLLETPSFSLQVSTGILQQFTARELTTFDLSTTIPQLLSTIKLQRAQSFLRLSNNSVMVSTSQSISIYNPKYQSIMASMQLDDPTSQLYDSTDFEQSERKRKRDEKNISRSISHAYKLVTYFPKLNTAIAIANNDLVAIQMEGKSHAAGLLIDSLGCSIGNHSRPGSDMTLNTSVGLTTMGSYLAGSIGMPEATMKKQTILTERAFDNDNTTLFDDLMAKPLGGSWPKITNGDHQPLVNEIETISTAKAETRARKSPLKPSEVDKRWILYALKKIFTWVKGDDGEYSLHVSFYPPNVFAWLLKTGNMTIVNIESALRSELRASALDAMPTGQLVGVLVEMDPEMELLHALISKNFLPAGELVSAIRIMMESLGLFGDSGAAIQQAIMVREENMASDDEVMEDEVKELEAQIESDLALAEFRLKDDSDRRGEALDLALAKLYTCPSEAIVYALQTIFTAQEIMALIYQLRFQLRNGSWTSRYADISLLDDEGEEGERQDNSMIVICSLLHNCIDSVGAGGWISGDDRLVNGDPFEAEEFIAGLSFEVSAALEGIEEAEYIRGLLECMVQYGQKVQGPEISEPTEKKRKTMSVPILLPSADENLQVLPIGLKAGQKVARQKVIPGSGELVQRSKRDIGQLKSKKVGKYSLERIVI
jgi:hypothetical protein